MMYEIKIYRRSDKLFIGTVRGEDFAYLGKIVIMLVADGDLYIKVRAV